MNIIPLKALAPYNADDAPGRSSTLATSSSESPIKFPNTKFKAGEELSIPSTSCIKRVLATVAKPLVLTDLNPKLLVLK